MSRNQTETILYLLFMMLGLVLGAAFDHYHPELTAWMFTSFTLAW